MSAAHGSVVSVVPESSTILTTGASQLLRQVADGRPVPIRDDKSRATQIEDSRLSESSLTFLLKMLAIVFASEAVVSFLLAVIAPGGLGVVLDAACDSLLLALIISPIVWFQVVRPRQARFRQLSLLNDQLHDQKIRRGRTEQALRENSILLANVLDSIPQSVFWKDDAGVYLGCNSAFARDAAVLSPQAILGKTDFDLPWSAEQTTAYRADDAEVIRSNCAKRHIIEQQSQADGTKLWIDTSKVPLVSEDGRARGVLGIYEDITERKVAELALRAAHEETELYFSSVPSILIGLDLDGRIGRWNAAAAKTFGLQESLVRTKSLSDCGVTWLCSDAAGEFDSWIRLASPHRCSDLPFLKDNETRFLDLTVIPVASGAGESIGLLVTGADITERTRLEEQLRQAQKLEAIGQLAAGIAHEINTPVQYVSDNAAFLRTTWPTLGELLALTQTLRKECETTCSQETIRQLDDCLDASSLDYLLREIPQAIDQSLHGLQHVAKIVRCMKEFAHPDSSSKELVDINRAIETTITIARNEWKYVAEVQTRLDLSLPPVSCFPGELNQVILNLIVNAADAIRDNVAAGQKGEITVTTCQKGEFVEVSIRDTGKGIPREIQSRVFEPFFTTKPVGKGSGQGLALAHAIVVKKHAGKIWFESETGRGTTFFVHLPLAKVAMASS